MAAALIEFTGGAKLQAALEKIADDAGKGKTLSVGFMSGAKYPDGTNVAMVAAIQNFGAPEANIPARPFFSNMVKAKSPGWGKDLGNALVVTRFDGETALGLMGEVIGSDLQTSIIETNEPELSPATIAAKGFAKPLIDTGVMLNSVSYDVDGERTDMQGPDISGLKS